MLNIGSATRIYLATGVTDMRKSFEGLYALVKSRLELDPLNGHLYVFCNRWRNRIKVLYWDGSGLWVCAKRLEKGRFAWPQGVENQKTLTMTGAQWTLLIEGIDLRHTRSKNWYRIPTKES